MPPPVSDRDERLPALDYAGERGAHGRTVRGMDVVKAGPVDHLRGREAQNALM
jgi:hypothetical protein